MSVYLSREPDLFPNLLLSMISVGEKSGELDNILQKAADFYEVEVDSSLKDLVVFLEPAMLFSSPSPSDFWRWRLLRRYIRWWGVLA